MNDEEMEQSFRLKLNDAGADISELKAGIRFSTSDIGASKVYASVFYDADGVRTTCNLPVNQLAELLIMDGAVRKHRRYNGNARTTIIC